MPSLKATISGAARRLGLTSVNAGRSAIGLKDGFPVQLSIEEVENSTRIVELVRFGDASRDAAVREAILASTVPVFFRPDRIHVAEGIAAHWHVRKPFRSAPVDRIVAELEALVQAVGRAVPEADTSCRTCQGAVGSEPILLQGMVDRVCPACIQRLQHDARVESERYDALPANLSLAVPVAALLALVSAVGYAAIGVVLSRFLWLVPVGIGLLLARGATLAAGKGGRPVQVLSAVLTVLATLLGHLLFIGWRASQHVRSHGHDFDWRAFASNVPKVLESERGEMIFSLVVGLLGAVFAFRRAGRPKLDVSVERPGTAVPGRSRPADRVGRDVRDGPVGWSTMAGLLEDLERLAEAHEEVHDTAVREQLWAVIEQGVIKRTPSFSVPSELGMFSPEANAALADLLRFHVKLLNETFDAFALTEQQRLASFFNAKLHTERGTTVEDFFGSP